MTEKTTQPAPAAEETLVDVTVIVDGHKHEREPVKKNTKIKVTPAVRDWMINNELGK